MSSSRLMDVGKAVTPGEPRMSKSVALAIVGLVGFIFMCSSLFYLANTVKGMVGGESVQTTNENVLVVEYGHRDIFAVVTVEDRVNCFSRPRWYIAAIQTPTATVYECHPR